MVAPTLPTPAAGSAHRPAAGAAGRAFGRFELKQLLGKSAASMVWLARDPRLGADVMLAMPRVQPPDDAALEHWQRDLRRTQRLDHPHLAPVLEFGVQDHWPYAVVERRHGVTLGEWIAAHPRPAPLEAAGWFAQALRGLAFAHEAGIGHGDLQRFHLLVSDQGSVRVMALGVATSEAGTEAGEAERAAHDRGLALDTGRLRAQRDAGVRDVLAAGILLHEVLTGAPVLDEPDVTLAIARLAPAGREVVRLPWTTPHPIPEALRAIVNRCTATQERQRYLNARTLLRALDGWRAAEAADSGGPLALLLDRLRSVGHLPAMPGVTSRVARLATMDGQHTDLIAEQVLRDLALSFEMLRQVNSAQALGSQSSGAGPVLTIRRALALMGLDGLRQCAASLRPWPGPMGESAAFAMQRLVERVRLAGHLAQALRPPGYDPEVMFLVATLQNLGRLLVQYHFPDEAEQIWQLMRPAPPPAGSEPGTPEQPGLSEAAASFAVLGVGTEDLGAAVARHWGLGEEMQDDPRAAARPHAAQARVRHGRAAPPPARPTRRSTRWRCCRPTACRRR